MTALQFILVFGVLSAVQWFAAAQEIPVAGVRSGVNTRTGEMPIRRNINSVFDERGPQWDLYIAALTAMQDANETDPTSYFQIAGIHGQPYMAWSGGGPQTGADAGYCPHNQVLVRQAKRIAISYPEPHKRKYLEAAESLRIAYWDWAENHQVPPVTAMPTVIVNKPVAGLVQPASVRNPLYRFKYPQSALDGYFGRFDGTNSTRRCANDGETYPETANEKLAGFNLKEKTLHHANVDRLIAFWQSLHFENAKMHFSYTSNEMFATPAGTTVTPQYPIWPFMGSGGSPLTSESVTHVRDWGYTYEPMRFWDQAPGETKMAVRRTVNLLYGPSEQQRKRGLSPQGLRRRKEVTKREYFAKVEVERGELELPCQVQLYLKGKLAGSFTLLDMPKKGKSYDEIPLSRGVEVAGFRGLSSKSVLGDVEYGLEVVINNKACADGDFAQLDGTTTPLDRVPSLKIEVEDVNFVAPDSLNELPTIGEAQCRAVKARPLTISN
ncbi:Tyrosinase [Colletotrichum higginsianum]|uniref:Tyrosinase n=1 Tax=Colletotrichum higginsianum TaxID=80884 RepID=A0A4T0WLQ0_9PEZI|nr:Tyrosinase [Colletotrichum higginsianum]